MVTEGRSGRGRGKDNYAHHTLRPINSLVFLAPLLIFFHWGTAQYGTDLVMPRTIYAMLKYFGGAAVWLPAMFIAVVLLAQQFAHKDGWKVHPKALAGMAGESIFWTGPLIALSFMTGQASFKAALWDLSPAAEQHLQQALQAVGAGVYEEFVFRLIFIDLALLIFVDILSLRKEPVAVAAVIVAAVVFSLCHFAPEAFTGQVHFSRTRFIFLAIAGVYWGSLYMFRGFGIAVGCHVLWDVYALLAQGQG